MKGLQIQSQLENRMKLYGEKGKGSNEIGRGEKRKD